VSETPDLTVDQLAARVGMTVRNVRAYAARGLLPPPRLVGRTGYYGPDHVARLTLVRELLAQGFTLAAVQKAIEEEPASDAGSLALHRAVMAPWLPDAPQESDLETLAARIGATQVTDIVGVAEELARLGVLELLEQGRLRILDPALLDAGIRGVRLGLPAAALVSAQRQVVELLERAAETYVAMFRDTLWTDHLEAGAPPERWADLQTVVQGLQPVATQAVLASFRSAMAVAVATEVDRLWDQHDPAELGQPEAAPEPAARR
jgi:DNA-binding transcriptional MerR regulator